MAGLALLELAAADSETAGSSSPRAATTIPSMPATTTYSEDQWDAFVLRHGGGFLQSWGWSQFQEALGRTVFRFRLDESEGAAAEDASATKERGTVAQFMLVVQPMRFGLRRCYLPHGPLVATDTGDALERLVTVLETLRQAAVREGAIFTTIEPAWPRVGGPVDEAGMKSLGLRQCKSIQPADSLVLDLNKSEEELLAAMHPKTRYNIRLAQRHGVAVREAAYGNAHQFGHDLELFWKLMTETTERDGFRPHPRAYYEKMLDVLSAKKHQGLLRVRLVFAEYQGEAVATAVMAAYGDTVTYLHGASSARMRSIMAPHALHWQLITEAKRQGFKKYDFWGVAPENATVHPWAGVSRFKLGFGGQRVSYIGAWDLIGNEFWYRVYRTFRK